MSVPDLSLKKAWQLSPGVQLCYTQLRLEYALMREYAEKVPEH